MRAGVLAIAAIGLVIVALTMPASAFNSGTDAANYFGSMSQDIDDHRITLGDRGIAFETSGDFAPRLPEDDFDDQMLQLVGNLRVGQGLQPAKEYEPLRVQATMWSNRMADAGPGQYLTDSWYPEDTTVVCRQLDQVFSISSAAKNSTPQSVLNYWLESHPAAAARLTMPDPVFLGSATVVQGDTYWTTLRIAQGACPGDPRLPSDTPAEIPAPDFTATAHPLGIQLLVAGASASQLSYQVQELKGEHWDLSRKGYTEVGRTAIISHLPAGTYRVVIPAQAGRGTGISPDLILE